jgi:Dyp-type peroxidase family
MDHAFITITIPFDVKPDVVNDALKKLGNPAHPDIAARLKKTGVVHFMSLTVLEADVGEPSHLMLEATCDGSQDSAIDAIAEALEEELHDIFEVARIFPDAQLRDVLRGHSRTLGQSLWSTTGLPFAGTPGMSVQRILREQCLAERITRILAGLPSQGPAIERLEQVRDKIWAWGDMKWAFVPEAAPCLGGAPESGLNPLVKQFFGDAIPDRPIDLLHGVRTAWKIALSGALTFLFPLLPLLIVLLAIPFGWYWSNLAGAAIFFAATIVLVALASALVSLVIYLQLRKLEESDEPDDYEPRKDAVAELMEHETFGAQNLMFAVSKIKPGRLRNLTLRFAFWSVGLGRYFTRPGFLGSNGIIHFARWLRVPGTDKLVFYSNFDGTWLGYVGDFVASASGAHGVTGIWTNCVGFPRTKGLVKEGAVDRDRLVRWARNQGRPVLFWYSAYPDLTTERIRINAAIRQGLASAESEADAADWLACFGSLPRPAHLLQTTEIQTLAFGALSRSWYTSCLIVRFGDNDPIKARLWLNPLKDEVTYGEVTTHESALAIGLSSHALEQLGLSSSDLATFPVAFQQGMDADYRARALRDIGESAPGKWTWGGARDKRADAIVLIYGKSDGHVRVMKHKITNLAAELGHSIPFAKDFPPRASSKEAFGFFDGVSQPAMRGTKLARRKDSANDILEPGELVLGYPDGLGRFAPTPTICASADPARLLHSEGDDPYRQRPEFSRARSTGRRDIGRNGTFLVVRQLEQNVDAFNTFLERAGAAHADRLTSGDVGLCKELLAAKMVGRWKNGTPLVRYPTAPGPDPKPSALPENDFQFADDDPMGLRCPIGAHIRRANPRDSFAGGSKEQFATVNRHRILRVGRSYNAEGGGKPGLLFMCVNVDIERQFEFIQQRWMLNPSFQGLQNETDPALGSDVLTVPTESGPVQVTGLQQFVTTRGGAYFFLPSRAALDVLANLP